MFIQGTTFGHFTRFGDQEKLPPRSYNLTGAGGQWKG